MLLQYSARQNIKNNSVLWDVPTSSNGVIYLLHELFRLLHQRDFFKPQPPQIYIFIKTNCEQQTKT